MNSMRLDKYFSNAKVLTRKETEKEIKLGNIKINGITATKKDQKVFENDIVTYKGQQINLVQFVYIMVNKPSGYVSSTDDPRDKTVLDLLPEDLRKFNLFPCGRLDKDTVGLVILTNDGIGAHNLLSPKKHVSKDYYFKLAEPISKIDIVSIEKGVTLKDGYTTKPCSIVMNDDISGVITLTEGKYHEIRRLFASKGNLVTYLQRISFGTIKLDENLKEGEYRMLTSDEISLFENSKSN